MADQGPAKPDTLHQTIANNAEMQGTKFAVKADHFVEKGQGHIPKKQGTDGSKKDKGPAGGFDDTPIPHAPLGYDVKFTFHRATNLPVADINSLSSDPFVLAQVNTNLRRRHRQDPELRFRTHTIRKNLEPVWEDEWIVANVPASGFELKCRVYDEDPADHDDRLGNVDMTVGPIGEGWNGIREQAFKIKKRKGSKRAYLFRGCAAIFSKEVREHMGGELVISIQTLGRTQPPEGEDGGRLYTIGPCYWSQHFSALLGKLTGTKDPVDEDKDHPDPEKKKAQKYK